MNIKHAKNVAKAWTDQQVLVAYQMLSKLIENLWENLCSLHATVTLHEGQGHSNWYEAMQFVNSIIMPDLKENGLEMLEALSELSNLLMTSTTQYCFSLMIKKIWRGGGGGGCSKLSLCCYW